MSAANSRRSRWVGVTLALVLVGSFLLQLQDLDHLSIKTHDEVFHAIVARNLLDHPLTPTLVENAYLPFDYRNWQANHVWLHKPPLALWQIALSFKLAGVSTLALRVPSAIEATLAVLLTFLIGCELLDEFTGLIAAALQAFNPVIVMLVHGAIFSDHVDIALLFWTELAIYFLARTMRNGRRIDALLCGAAQGLAFLSKTYPALIVTGLALVAWLLPRSRFGRTEESRLTGRLLLLTLAATFAVAGPWNIYAAIRFPNEYVYENFEILSHLNQDIQGWAAPWDRLLFGYWISIFEVYYPAVLAATVLAIIIAVRQRQTKLWIVLAWGFGVLIPNLLATSKPPVATLIGLPAMWLLLGFMIRRAFCGGTPALAGWLVSMLLAAFLLTRNSIPTQGWGGGDSGTASIMLQNQWVIWQTLAALAAAGAAAWIAGKGIRLTRLQLPLSMIAAAAMLFLAVRWWKGDHPRGYLPYAYAAATEADPTDFSPVGIFAGKLPANAAFIVDESVPLENKLIEFWADRTCYVLKTPDWADMAQQLIAAGALPYLVTSERASLPVVYDDGPSQPFVYACTPLAKEKADAVSEPK